jgi:hypothetical protein
MLLGAARRSLVDNERNHHVDLISVARPSSTLIGDVVLISDTWLPT